MGIHLKVFLSMESSVSQTSPFAQIRNNAETINATFNFVRLHRKTLLKSVMLRAFPFLLFSSVLYVWLFVFPDSSIGRARLFQVLLWVAVLFLGQSMLVAVVHGFAKLADKYPPGDFDEVDVWEEAKSLFGSVLGTNLALVFLVAFGVGGLALVVARIPVVGFLILSGIIFLVVVSWCLYYPARFLEGSSFSEAFTLSRYLVSGYWWTTAGLLFVWWLLLTMLTFLFSVTSSIVDVLAMGYLPVDAVANDSLYLTVQAISTLISMSLWSLLNTLPMLGLIFHFYSQLERKDGAGLAELVETIGEEVASVNSEGEEREGGPHDNESWTDV